WSREPIWAVKYEAHAGSGPSIYADPQAAIQLQVFKKPSSSTVQRTAASFSEQQHHLASSSSTIRREAIVLGRQQLHVASMHMQLCNTITPIRPPSFSCPCGRQITHMTDGQPPYGHTWGPPIIVTIRT
ncbi:hypothetical protein Dimus_030256, partial [Dionaea muscipula]